MRLSYLITVYNKRPDLPHLLESLYKQKGLEDVEVDFVFSDDFSNDGSVAFLKACQEKDPRIIIIENEENRGPTHRINQAAKRAQGDYFIALDSDDYLPENASALFLKTIESCDVDLVFGQTKRGPFPPPAIKDSPHIDIHKDALGFTAEKKIVHMGFISSKTLWHEAGGADERLFIQDQSLPLRLSAKATKLAYVSDVVYWLKPKTEESLSANRIQQHHDRFFSALYQFQLGKMSNKARLALLNQMISACWKLSRDTNKLAYLSPSFANYLLFKLCNLPPSANRLMAYANKMSKLDGVRRPS